MIVVEELTAKLARTVPSLTLEEIPAPAPTPSADAPVTAPEARELVTCSDCGNPYELSERQAREIRAGRLVPRCRDCRSPGVLAPGPREHRWVARLDQGERERLLAAVSVLMT